MFLAGGLIGDAEFAGLPWPSTHENSDGSFMFPTSDITHRHHLGTDEHVIQLVIRLGTLQEKLEVVLFRLAQGLRLASGLLRISGRHVAKCTALPHSGGNQSKGSNLWLVAMRSCANIPDCRAHGVRLLDSDTCMSSTLTFGDHAFGDPILDQTRKFIRIGREPHLSPMLPRKLPPSWNRKEKADSTKTACR